jgi:hypothetical protein
MSIFSHFLQAEEKETLISAVRLDRTLLYRTRSVLARIDYENNGNKSNIYTTSMRNEFQAYRSAS